MEEEYKYLENMPVPVAILKISNSIEEIEKRKLLCIYMNHAFEKLEGIKRQKLTGEKFHTIFHNDNDEWIKIYSRTAYDGISQTLTEYSIELDKFLEISTYQPQYGYCACIVKDTSREFIMKKNIGLLQKKIDIIISKTTDVIFDFDLERKVITNSEISIRHFKVQKYISDVPDGLIKEKLLKEEYREELQTLIDEIRAGKKEGSIEIEMRLNQKEEFHWYRLFLCSYYQDFETQMKVIGFIRNITDEINKRHLLEAKASHDDLTGLYNRYGGISKIQEMIEQQHKNVKPHMKLSNAMFLFDLDNFKQANDRYGHEQGDLILCYFANILKESFNKDNVIIRLGGDEFIVFVPRINKEEIKQMCEKIIHQEKMEKLKKFGVSVSIGIVIGKSDEYDTYYRNADQAMYSVKKKMKNGYCIVEEC